VTARALVFLDTETTGLRHDRRAWEVGAIRRDLEGKETTLHLFVDVPLDDADLNGLRVGRFYDRHPYFADTEPACSAEVATEAEAARAVERFTRGAVLVGNNPAYDAATLDPMLRRHGLLPAWHYQLIDVVPLAAGYVPRTRRPAPPWRSVDVGMMVGVAPPAEDAAHTALGDARWVRDVFDAVVRGVR